jgi:tRNA(Ile2)-agmatinylcytidine synthase
VRRRVVVAVEGLAEFQCGNTNPGIVFHNGEVPDSFKDFSDRVVQGVVTLEDALSLIDEAGAQAIGYKNMRGLIGALAAVGGLQRGDHTFEVLTYRRSENCGAPRLLDEGSVRTMDEALGEATFNNVDPESGRVLIAPHGPDPVLYGVRGETPGAVHRAHEAVRPLEPVELWAIFRSNQGTDAHLRHRSNVDELEPYCPAIVSGEVAKAPRTIKGGHVIFGLSDETGRIDCAAYEPTGSFREVVRKLIPGDAVRAYGGVREEGSMRTLNLEKMEVLELSEDLQMVNPACPYCAGAMESMGRGKGYRCRRCGYRDSKLGKQPVVVDRELEVGLYIPPAGAQRHLTKPLSRYGKEKEYVPGELFQPWHGA